MQEADQRSGRDAVVRAGTLQQGQTNQKLLPATPSRCKAFLSLSWQDIALFPWKLVESNQACFSSEQSGLLFITNNHSQNKQLTHARKAHVSSADITVAILISQGFNAAVERNLQVFSRTGSNRQVQSVH